MVVSVLIAGLLLAGSPALYAQVTPVPPLIQMDWQLRTVRASGQPVIPIFEGWYTNEDGTYDLCFGFFNLNREESLDIPIGENNFIEPSRFNGLQPTHFPALGWGDSSGRPGRMVREYCVFAVNVPGDIGSDRVWWNLRIDGQTYRVPGHITSRPWNVDNLVNSVGVSVMDFDQDAIQGVLTAPIVRFIEPAGAATRGKGGVTVGPFTTRVGAPLSLTISVTHPDEGTVAFGDLDPDEEGVLAEQSLKWSQFSGPAAMTSFRPQRSRFEVGPEPTEQTTEVTFERPGDYVLLVQVLNGSFSSQCCWTNAYVNVTVAP